MAARCGDASAGAAQEQHQAERSRQQPAQEHAQQQAHRDMRIAKEQRDRRVERARCVLCLFPNNGIQRSKKLVISQAHSQSTFTVSSDFSRRKDAVQVALPQCAPAEQIFPSGLSRERSVGWSRANDGTIDKQRPSSSNGRRSWDHDRLAPRVDCDSRSGPSCAEAAPTGGAVAEAADSRE